MSAQPAAPRGLSARGARQPAPPRRAAQPPPAGRPGPM